jgi:hypothetical protein
MTNIGFATGFLSKTNQINPYCFFNSEMYSKQENVTEPANTSLKFNQENLKEAFQSTEDFNKLYLVNI